MRFSLLLAALPASLMFAGSALAEGQTDLDRCGFVGEIGKADDGIAACDRVINDSKTNAQDRAAALSSRC